LKRDGRGASALTLGLGIGLVAAVAVVAIQGNGDLLEDLFYDVSTSAGTPSSDQPPSGNAAVADALSALGLSTDDIGAGGISNGNIGEDGQRGLVLIEWSN